MPGTDNHPRSSRRLQRGGTRGGGKGRIPGDSPLFASPFADPVVGWPPRPPAGAHGVDPLKWLRRSRAIGRRAVRTGRGKSIVAATRPAYNRRWNEAILSQEVAGSI